MHHFLNSPLLLGNLNLEHRLIQGPLAGYSCAPFRALFSLYQKPAYAVSEMLSAHKVIHNDKAEGRYLARSSDEKLLCYQIAGTSPDLMATAALRLEAIGADLIDINCGCPKAKIRKKGAGSALLDKPEQLTAIVKSIKAAITIPLTVKVRLLNTEADFKLAEALVDAGADALIIHARHWKDNYDTPCNFEQLAKIKQRIPIPVIANGDLAESDQIRRVYESTGADAFMISRAGTGKPWLYQELLSGKKLNMNMQDLSSLFILHLNKLAQLECEYKAILQSKSLIRYYFQDRISQTLLASFYNLSTIDAIQHFLEQDIFNKYDC